MSLSDAIAMKGGFAGSRWRRFPITLAVTVAALLIVGWLVATRGGLGLTDLERLQRLDQATLAYPGSTLIASGGNDTIRSLAGSQEAATWAQYGAEASPDEILSFYDKAIGSAGWEEGGGISIIGAFHESQVCSWHDRATVLRLSLWKPEKWQEAHPSGPAFQTVYEVRLLDGSPADHPAPCWKPRT